MKINISVTMAWWFDWILMPATRLCVWLRLSSMRPVIEYFARKAVRVRIVR